MEREQLQGKLEDVLHNMNIQGLELLNRLCGGFDKIPMYNINTTPEQYAALKAAEEEKRQQELAEREAKKQKDTFERIAQENKERDAKIEAFEGKDKIFYNKIETVKKMEVKRYLMSFSEVMLLADLHHNNYINASYDAFCYGFYQGRQYALKDIKKKNNKS